MAGVVFKVYCWFDDAICKAMRWLHNRYIDGATAGRLRVRSPDYVELNFCVAETDAKDRLRVRLVSDISDPQINPSVCINIAFFDVDYFYPDSKEHSEYLYSGGEVLNITERDRHMTRKPWKVHRRAAREIIKLIGQHVDELKI